MSADELPSVASGRVQDLRQLEIRRLLGLMGGMLSDSYADACALLSQEPRMATVSHLVGHLARETESALRELLSAMIPADRMAALQDLPRGKDQRDPPLKAVIDEICTALGIDPDDDVRDAWKSLKWHTMAHRAALRQARPVEEDFLQDWGQFEFVLLTICRRYEASYLAALPLIDELAAIDAPSRADRSKLKNQVPQSIVAMAGFFDAAGPGWFDGLRRGGFFASPPRLQPNEDGMVAYAPWPAGRYLVRMVSKPKLAEKVIEALLALDTDNPEACESTADAAMAMPPSGAARLAPKVAEFLGHAPQWALPSKASKLAVTLAANGQQDAALTIVKNLLPAPPRSRTGHRYVPFNLLAPAFVDLGAAALTLLADRITEGIDGSGGGYQLRYSAIWRPAIESDHYRDNLDQFVSALRDAAVAVAQSSGAREVVEVLEGYGSGLFTRVALHVLRQVQDADLVTQRLTSRDLFDNPEVAHEYTLLLRDSYVSLGRDDQARILGFIDDGPTYEVSDEDADRWRQHKLAGLGDAVPEDRQQQLEALTARFGPPEVEESPFQFAERTGSQSPVDADAIAAMPDDDLTAFLETWRPEGGWRAPTIDGLREQLEAAVQADPDHFAALAPRFNGLDPTYVWGLLAALTRVVSADLQGAPSEATATTPYQSAEGSTAGELFAWEPVIELGQSLIDDVRQPGSESALDDENGSNSALCHRQFAGLLETAMRHDRVEPRHSQDLLALIVQLAQDPEPRPGQVMVTFSDSGEDPCVEVLNTVRGRAFLALMEYIRWQHRQRATDNAPAEIDEPVRELLEKHLEPTVEPSTAVRSAYGIYFGALATCDPTWAAQHVAKIFNDSHAATLSTAAWQAFVRFNRASEKTYMLLKDLYLDAVRALATAPVATEDDMGRPATEATNKLITHLAVLYGTGVLPMDDALIRTFFTERTPLHLRARMVEICGRITVASPPSVLQRMRELWESRLQEAIAAATHVSELTGFPSWLQAAHDPGWKLAQLRALLTAGGSPEPTHTVAEELTALRHDDIRAVVECMAMLIDAAKDPWFVPASRAEIQTVLADGLNAPDAQTRRLAAETVNRLVARGNTDFGELLPG